MGLFGSSSSTVKVEMLTPDQKKLLRQLSTLLGGQLGKSAEVYQGQIAPDASALQNAFFGAQQGNVDSFDQYAGGQPAYEIDPAARERVYNAQRASAMDEYDDFTRIAAEKYNARGSGRSGSIQRSFARGAARLGNQLNETRAGLEYQDELSRRSALESGANRGLGALQGQQGALGMLGQAGGLQRDIQGQQNTEAYNRWQAGQAYANPWMQYLPQVFGTQAFTPGTQSNETGIIGSGIGQGLFW